MLPRQRKLPPHSPPSRRATRHVSSRPEPPPPTAVNRALEALSTRIRLQSGSPPAWRGPRRQRNRKVREGAWMGGTHVVCVSLLPFFDQGSPSLAGTATPRRVRG